MPDEKINGQNVDIFYRFKDTTDVLIKIKRGVCANNNSIIATENVYPAEQGVVGLKIQECY
ncbi:hypothetical protein HYV49_04760 [Candidatus Pacearchaeota archaeon]|nr:hypothetical protein [Candidatus Pacearchaeota archaeon]